MSKLYYRIRTGEAPQGKPNVYFSCHPDDFNEYFKEYSDKILRVHNCVVWYESEPEADYDREDLEINLSQMQVFIMPVTRRLLTTKNRVMDMELPLALKKHIPVLPLLMEDNLDSAFSERFGDLQYLVPNDEDKTRRRFEYKFETFIKAVLADSSLTEKVRAAFAAYIFLSYRKVDRKKALELMRLIHRHPLYRDIAIWYDEFLTPGEDFNREIRQMLQNSDIFVLVVTPSLLEKDNYVMAKEYPAVIKQKKPILPIEMEETDRDRLEGYYEALPPCVPGEETEAFQAALSEKLTILPVKSYDDSPAHKFLIGAAYLEGIDVEIDNEKALELIMEAAEAGIPEAIEYLVVMYETGKGIKTDPREGIKWRKKQIKLLRERYEAELSDDRAEELIRKLWDLGEIQLYVDTLDAAEATFNEVRSYTEKYENSDKYQYRKYLADSFDRLGGIFKERKDLEKAQEYYEKGCAVYEKLARENGTDEVYQDFMWSIYHLGDLMIMRGDLEGAQRCYEKGCAFEEELVLDESRRYLIVWKAKKDASERVKADREEERGYYEKKRITEEAELSSGHLSWKYSRLRAIAGDRGDFRKAQMYFKREIAVFEKLIEDVGKSKLLLQLGMLYYDFGNTLEKDGNLGEAQEYYKKACTIYEEDAKEKRTDESRRDLIRIYEKLGSVAKKRNDLKGIKEYYEKACAIYEELADEKGTDESRRDLVRCYEKLGKLVEDYGDFDGAYGYYEKICFLYEKFLKKKETDELRRNLIRSYERLGDLFEDKQDFENAQRYYKKARAAAEALPEEKRALNDTESLAYIYFKLTGLAEAQGELELAQEYCDQELTIREKVAVETGTEEARLLLIYAFTRLLTLGSQTMINTEGVKRHCEICFVLMNKETEEGQTENDT